MGAGRQFTASREGLPLWAVFYKWITPLLGAIVLLNIRAHMEFLQQLSLSLHWLTDWYRALVGIPFSVLPHSVPNWTKDVFVVACIVMAGAQVTMLTAGDRRHFACASYSILWHSRRSSPASAGRLLNRILFGYTSRNLGAAVFGATLAGIFASAAIVGTVEGLTGELSIPFIAAGLAVILLPGTLSEFNVIRSSLIVRSSNLLAGSFIALGVATLACRRAVGRSLLFFVAVLLVDFGFSAWGDPFLTLLQDLPAPPGN